MPARLLLSEFGTANPLYAGAVVNVYGVDASGAKDTANRLTLYTALTGTGTIVNPQTLNSKGMWPTLAYIEEPAIVEVSGPHVASHDTGLIEPPSFGTGQATATDEDTTPDVLGVSYLLLANTVATSVTDFDNPANRQRLVVEHTTANTTLVHAAGILLLQGSVNATPAAGTMQEFLYDGTLWREISRITP